MISTEDFNNLKIENDRLKKEIKKRDKKDKKNRQWRNWFLRKIATPIIGPGLKNSIINSIDEFNDKKTLSKNTFADLVANIIWRITRIGFFAIIIAAIPIFLLFQQNRLISKQNHKIDEQTILFDSQNKFIQQQSFLAEASRRSTQMIIMGDVLSDLNKELEDEKNQSKTLSSTLVGRIISLSSVMKPYLYLENGELIEKPISPERGQLLVSLITSDIDTLFLKQNILKKCDFSYSDLQNVTLQNAYLNEAKLSNSNFKGASIIGSHFKFTQLSGSDFNNCIVMGSDFEQAFFVNAILSNATFSNSNFENAEMRRTQIVNTNLQGSNIKGVNFRNSILYNINLVAVDIGKSIYVDDRRLKRDSSDLFARPYLTNTSFESVRYINNLTVDRIDWLQYAKDSLIIKGLDNLTITSNIGTQSKDFGHRHNAEGKKIDMFVLSVEDSLANKINDQVKDFFGN